MRNIILDYDEFALHVLKQELARRYTFSWKCKNGDVVALEDMSSSSLKYVIDVLESYLVKERAVVQENYLNGVLGVIMDKRAEDLRRIAEEVQIERAQEAMREAASNGKFQVVIGTVPDHFIQELKECGFVTNWHDGIGGWNVKW